MAKKQKRKGPSGIGYVGKKVETEIREFSSDLFFKKAKANNEAGLTYISFNSEGKLIQEFQGRKFNTLSDDNAAITASELVNAGILLIDPTSSRAKTIPTLSAMFAFIPEDFSAYDFTIVNTNATNQLRLAAGDTDTAIVGDIDIRPGTSATFRLLNLVSEMLCVRLNSDRNSADITSVVAGTNLTGGATSGAATINLADASTSVKGAASFSSDNFAASSGAITIKDGGVDLTAEVTGVLPSANLDADTAHLSTTQTFTGAKTFNETISGSIDGNSATTTKHIVVTTHNFQLANTTGTFFYVPFNNLNESSTAGMSNYWTRTVPPYAGTVKKIAVRSQTSLGTGCELRVSKITDTTDGLPSGTHVDATSIDISTAHTSVITTMGANSFAAGDAVGVAIKRSAGTSAQVVLTIAWEYTI